MKLYKSLILSFFCMAIYSCGSDQATAKKTTKPAKRAMGAKKANPNASKTLLTKTLGNYNWTCCKNRLRGTLNLKSISGNKILGELYNNKNKKKSKVVGEFEKGNLVLKYDKQVVWFNWKNLSKKLISGKVKNTKYKVVNDFNLTRR